MMAEPVPVRSSNRGAVRASPPGRKLTLHAVSSDRPDTEVVCTACNVDFDDFEDRAEAVYFARVHNGMHHGKHWFTLPASTIGSAHLRMG
jgi:hypothetical protein